MKLFSSFFIALRYLLGRAHEGGRYLRGAAGGIALSLVPIIVTLIVADGMIRGIMDRYLELGTGHLQVFNFQNRQNPEAALPYIEGFPGIRGIWSERQGLGVLLGSAGTRGAAIRAIEPSFWEDEGALRFLVTLEGEGRLLGDRDVLLGSELARSIGAQAGNTVHIMTISHSPLGHFIPRVTPFYVRGIVSSGYQELDAMWCVISLDAGLDILPDLGAAHLILKIDDPFGGSETMAHSLRGVLGTGFGVYSWRSLLRAQHSSFESTRQLLLFIMALIVLVAAVNVSSATSMLVIERQRDIAVLKTSGAKPSFTTSIFLMGAFLTGLTGSIFGIAAGLLVGVHVNGLIRFLEIVMSFFSGLFNAGPVTILDSSYYIDHIPIIIDANMIIQIGFFTILASVVASWIPAHRAGKLKPVDILRKY
ncbi:MAG: ABC transporter permease [Treponema sp.]|nr:ABC transporter permease [Treponema sp.]